MFWGCAEQNKIGFSTTFEMTTKNIKHIRIQLFKFFEFCTKINICFSEVFKNIFLILSPRKIFKLCNNLPILVLLDLKRGAGTCKKK